MDPAVWFLNDLVRVHLARSEGEGNASMVEFWSPAGDMPPLHRHWEVDELVYVIEGRLAFHQPDRRIEAGPGESRFLERGVPHTYEVLGGEPARFLMITVPGGFDEFVTAVAREATQPQLPEASEPDPAAMARAAERYGIELLGPPGTLP